MNKADLTTRLADRANMPKVRAAECINILTDEIRRALVEEEKVTISDFGTFQISHRKAFEGQNPKTRAKMDVSACRIPIFRAGKGFKSALNG